MCDECDPGATLATVLLRHATERELGLSAGYHVSGQATRLRDLALDIRRRVRGARSRTP